MINGIDGIKPSRSCNPNLQSNILSVSLYLFQLVHMIDSEVQLELEGICSFVVSSVQTSVDSSLCVSLDIRNQILVNLNIKIWSELKLKSSKRFKVNFIKVDFSGRFKLNALRIWHLEVELTSIGISSQSRHSCMRANIFCEMISLVRVSIFRFISITRCLW